MLKGGSDWKKSKPVDEGNVTVKVDSGIRYICPLEGTEQVNAPVLPDSGSRASWMRRTVVLHDNSAAPRYAFQ